MADERVTYTVVIDYTKGFEEGDVNGLEAYNWWKEKRKESLTLNFPATGGRMKAELVSISEA